MSKKFCPIHIKCSLYIYEWTLNITSSKAIFTRFSVRYMLLLKKKKYAAVTLEKDRDGNMIQKTELKGMRATLCFMYIYIVCIREKTIQSIFGRHYLKISQTCYLYIAGSA